MIDQENGLPSGWCLTNLGRLGNYINGRAFKPKEWKQTGLPIVRIQNLNDHNAAYNYSDEKHEEKYLITKGDLLVAWSASLGVYIWQFSDAWLNQHIFRVEVNNSVITKKFLFFVIQDSINDLYAKAHGSGIVHVTKGVFESHVVKLPPLPEQHRIVAEIEKQFSRLDEAVAGLKRIQANLKRYRASVLKSAVEGKLTAEWRKQHPDIEPAEQLLQRILKERREQWEQTELEKMQAAGKPPKDELWKQKYKEPVKPDLSGLPALPEGRVWATPEQLASINNYALAIGPFGSNLKVSDYCQEGVPLVFVKNIRSKSFDGENTKYVSETKSYELTAHKVNPGDILITKMGEPPGDACLYPLNCPPAIITADCIKWKLASILDNVFFFIYAINSQLLKLQIQKITKGVAQQKISLGRFKSLAIPLPSLQEQTQIVSEVERRLSIADEVEQQINTNLKRAERLRQSILKKAFSGKLVPQDSNDEPAGVLLEKIKQAQRA